MKTKSFKIRALLHFVYLLKKSTLAVNLPCFSYKLSALCISKKHQLIKKNKFLENYPEKKV